MKKHSSAIIVCLSIFLLFNAPLKGEEEATSCLYRIEQGKILLYSGESNTAIMINGKLERACPGDNGLYYIASRVEILGPGCYIGFIDFLTHAVAYEKKLPVNLAGALIKKFMASGGVVYILTGKDAVPWDEATLYRIPLNTMVAAERTGLADFALAGEDVVLLGKHEAGHAVIVNDSVVPVSLKAEGPLSIGDVIDARLVFVKGGDETEVIDILAGRSLYQYSARQDFLMPVDHNLEIEAIDDAVSDREERDMIFYKIFIDGLETGRTESGPARLSREFRINLGAHRYHLVRLERWLLKTGKGRYERENNIRQPKEQQIFIPMNRIVKLIIRFDGKNYRYDIAPVYRQ